MLRLSHREVRDLGAFIGVLSSPLGFPDSASWRREVIARGQQLLEVDRAVFGLEWDATHPVEDVGIDPAATPAFIDYYHQFDEAHQERRRRAMPVVGIRHELATGWPSHPEFRHDFLRRFQLDVGVGMGHDVAPGAPCFCAFYSELDAPDAFEEHVVPILQLAYPAFCAGLDTVFRVRGLRAEFARLIDQVTDGFLLVGPAGNVLHQNSALQWMLAADPQSQLLEARLDIITRRFAAGIDDAEGAAVLFRTTSVATQSARYDLIPTIPGPDLIHLGIALVLQVLQRTPPAIETDALRERFALTPRECEVTRCIVQGLSYKRIAQRLCVSIDTVRSHIRGVYSKLDVHTGAEAVSRVLEAGRP
jgi:DNA-binding CsgD family transcriptional regulator